MSLASGVCRREWMVSQMIQLPKRNIISIFNARRQTPDARLSLILGALILTLALTSCSSITGTADGTSGSETGNALIAGRIVDGDGNAVVSARVMLIPAGHNPVGSEGGIIHTDTDKDGEYFLNARDTGIYNLESFNPADGYRSLLRNLRIDSGANEVQDEMLLPPAWAWVGLPDSQTAVSGHVYIKGTSRAYAKSAGRGRLLLDSLPGGDLPEVLFQADAAVSGSLLKDELSVVPGDTLGGENMLFVYHGPVAGVNEIRVMDHLRVSGIRLNARAFDSLQSSDLAGAEYIYLSSSLTSDTVREYFRDIPVPVIVAEANLFGHMGMTGYVFETDMGDMIGQTALEIAGPGHPAAGGFSGVVAVADIAVTMAWGKPLASSSVIARVPGDPDKAYVFFYAQGDSLAGMTAPALRMGMFVNYFTALGLNADGWKLFQSSVAWAIGRTD